MNIIELAKEAGFDIEPNVLLGEGAYVDGIAITKKLERFAALVREEERKHIAQRVADTTISFNVKVNQLGWEETRTVSISLADLKELIEEDK